MLIFDWEACGSVRTHWRIELSNSLFASSAWPAPFPQELSPD